MSANAARWLKSLLAVLVGNAVYFSLAPYLPPAARHQPLHFDLGIVVDFWFCLLVYGILNTLASLRRRPRDKQ
jgi:hypothetical protein